MTSLPSSPVSAAGSRSFVDYVSPVQDVLEYLAGGMSEEEILADFPDLAREDIRACLAFAADRERRLMSMPPF